MLAGRKLLLADDSITIQKIVALTFADEGIEVIAVSDGAEALQKLEETSPDLVLADVFMPRFNGYQVCEHIKQTERLKHIPVMLMIGSFEPFDEVEARRVGADDILSKPFQSIRTLMDKVGALLGRQPAVVQTEDAGSSAGIVAVVEAAPVAEPVVDSYPEIAAREETPDAVSQEANTQELPPVEFVAPTEEPMTTDELEITTADTQPLSPEVRDRMEHLVSDEVPGVQTVLEAEPMPTNYTEVNHESFASFDEGLLDLEQFGSTGFDADDDVILDIDFDAEPVSLPAAIPSTMVAQAQTGMARDKRFEAPAFNPVFSPAAIDAAPVQLVEESIRERAPEFGASAPVQEAVSSVAEAQQPATVAQAEVVSASSPTAGASAPAGLITLAQLTPEVIDAIARRAVEQLSERAVQEIAWEVVPQLSELLIKRKLEEQESQK